MESLWNASAWFTPRRGLGFRVQSEEMISPPFAVPKACQTRRVHGILDGTDRAVGGHHIHDARVAAPCRHDGRLVVAVDVPAAVAVADLGVGREEVVVHRLLHIAVDLRSTTDPVELRRPRASYSRPRCTPRPCRRYCSSRAECATAQDGAVLDVGGPDRAVGGPEVAEIPFAEGGRIRRPVRHGRDRDHPIREHPAARPTDLGRAGRDSTAPGRPRWSVHAELMQIVAPML